MWLGCCLNIQQSESVCTAVNWAAVRIKGCFLLSTNIPKFGRRHLRLSQGQEVFLLLLRLCYLCCIDLGPEIPSCQSTERVGQALAVPPRDRAQPQRVGLPGVWFSGPWLSPSFFGGRHSASFRQAATECEAPGSSGPAGRGLGTDFFIAWNRPRSFPILGWGESHPVSQGTLDVSRESTAEMQRS